MSAKPKWMCETDEESPLHNHKQKNITLSSQDTGPGEADQNNGNSIGTRNEASIDLDCSRTTTESTCKRKRAECESLSPRSQETLSESRTTQNENESSYLKNKSELLVKEEVIDLDYDDSSHSTHPARNYRDKSEEQNSFLHLDTNINNSKRSSRPCRDTWRNTNQLTVTENQEVFSQPSSSQPVSPRTNTFLPRDSSFQKSNSPEQHSNKQAFCASQSTLERTAPPSCTVTSKSLSMEFSDSNYMGETMHNRGEKSDIALCMKVETVDDLGNEIDMHELQDSELNEIRGLKTTYFSPNTTMNINERLDASGCENVSFGVPSFKGDNSNLQGRLL